MSDEDAMREEAKFEAWLDRPHKRCHECHGFGGNCPSCGGSGYEDWDEEAEAEKEEGC